MNDSQSRHAALAPTLLLAAGLIAVVPWLHPNNTCHDWLEKWGQLSSDRMWLPIHQVATAGFALAGMSGLFLPWLGRLTPLSLLGGAALCAGYFMQAMLVLIHGAAVSSLGAAFNRVPFDPQKREAIRTTAEAWVAYDVAVTGVAAVLLSTGAVLSTLALRRERVMGDFMALVLAGLGAIWGLAYFRGLGGEWVPYTSVALWLAGTGLLALGLGSAPAPASAQPPGQGARHELQAEAGLPQ
jgi:hypothetical protein